MDARVHKLQRYFDSSDESITALVAAGLDSPRALKQADDEDILAIQGIGPAKLAAIRARLGQ